MLQCFTVLKLGNNRQQSIRARWYIINQTLLLFLCSLWRPVQIRSCTWSSAGKSDFLHIKPNLPLRSGRASPRLQGVQYQLGLLSFYYIFDCCDKKLLLSWLCLHRLFRREKQLDPTFFCSLVPRIQCVAPPIFL